MQASELRPGQFFQYLTWRCMCVEVCQPTQTVVYVFQHGKSWEISRCGFRCNITPLAVTGWDDEPSECLNERGERSSQFDKLPTPAPLQLREGAWYRRRDGQTRGPARSLQTTNEWEQWELDEAGQDYPNTYHGNGRHCDNKSNCPLDLITEVPPPHCPSNLGLANCPTLCEPCKSVVIEDIGNGYSIKYDPLRKSNQWTALGPNGRIKDCDSRDSALMLCEAQSSPAKNGEVPPPVEPEQFKAGGWAVCVLEANRHLKQGAVCEVACVDGDWIGIEGIYNNYAGWHFSSFRHATPAEVAAYKQAQEPQRDAEGWIEHDGTGCPVDEALEVQCKLVNGAITRPRSAGDFRWSKTTFSGDITHYRLVPSPQTAPIVTDWVEVVTR